VKDSGRKLQKESPQLFCSTFSALPLLLRPEAAPQHILKKSIPEQQHSNQSTTSRMSFRKRNIGLSAGADRLAAANSSAQSQQASVTPESTPGIRPSPDDGRPTTSTGSRSLDNLLAGHGGLPIGKTLLIEENGTTDFAGALLRYYAAEGVVQDQKVHVVGMPEQWGRSLPALIGPADVADEKLDRRKGDRMKIAWRYERLGEFGAGVAGSRGKASIMP
jgi:elongator complex protein 4